MATARRSIIAMTALLSFGCACAPVSAQLVSTERMVKAFWQLPWQWGGDTQEYLETTSDAGAWKMSVAANDCNAAQVSDVSDTAASAVMTCDALQFAPGIQSTKAYADSALTAVYTFTEPTHVDFSADVFIMVDWGIAFVSMELTGPAGVVFAHEQSLVNPQTADYPVIYSGDLAPGTYTFECSTYAHATMFTTMLGSAANTGVDFDLVFSNIEPCVGDLDGDAFVGAGDLAVLLGAWGGTLAGADLDGDGTIGASDLALMLGAWGNCP